KQRNQARVDLEGYRERGRRELCRHAAEDDLVADALLRPEQQAARGSNHPVPAGEIVASRFRLAATPAPLVLLPPVLQLAQDEQGKAQVPLGLGVGFQLDGPAIAGHGFGASATEPERQTQIEEQLRTVGLELDGLLMRARGFFEPLHVLEDVAEAGPGGSEARREPQRGLVSFDRLLPGA